MKPLSIFHYCLLSYLPLAPNYITPSLPRTSVLTSTHQTSNPLIGSFVWTVTLAAQTPAPLLIHVAVFSSCSPLFHLISPSSFHLIGASISHGGSGLFPYCSPLWLRTHKYGPKHAPDFKPLLSASFMMTPPPPTSKLSPFLILSSSSSQWLLRHLKWLFLTDITQNK